LAIAKILSIAFTVFFDLLRIVAPNEIKAVGASVKIGQMVVVAALSAGLLGGCLSGPQGGSRYAYYDGSYGQYHGGFWGRDGHFYYYADASQRRFLRDDAGHFQASAQAGYREVRARPRERHYERRYERQQASAE
jgi:hypothetical protein